MTLPLWLALGLLAWVVLPFPIAIAIGRLFSGGSRSVVVIEDVIPTSQAVDARQRV